MQAQNAQKYGTIKEELKLTVQSLKIKNTPFFKQFIRTSSLKFGPKFFQKA